MSAPTQPATAAPTLLPCDQATARVSAWERYNCVEKSDNRGYNLFCHHNHKKPGTWSVHETRVDSTGRRWSRNLHGLVVDNFGTLVPVGGAA